MPGSQLIISDERYQNVLRVQKYDYSSVLFHKKMYLMDLFALDFWALNLESNFIQVSAVGQDR